MIGNLPGCLNFSLIFCRRHRKNRQHLDGSCLQIFLDKRVISNYCSYLSETNPPCSPVKKPSFAWYKVIGKRIKHTRQSLGTPCHILRDWCCRGLVQTSLMLVQFLLRASADLRMKQDLTMQNFGGDPHRCSNGSLKGSSYLRRSSVGYRLRLGPEQPASPGLPALVKPPFFFFSEWPY